MTILGTWNVENLFRPGKDGPSSEKDYDAKLASIAATINALTPTVLCVQEIGDLDALNDLIGRLDGSWHSATADPDGRGIRAGIISTVELSGVEQIRDFPVILKPIQVEDDGTTINRMGRPALRAQVTVNGISIDVVSTHLKSKLLTFPGGRFTPKDEGERARYGMYALARRAGEAAALRAGADTLIKGDGASNAVFIGGDLNDEPLAATTQILLGPGGSEIGTGGYNRPDNGDTDRLWNLAPLIPEPERYTRIYRGRRELIDHLLVSKALVEKAREVSTGSGKTPSITDNPKSRKDAAGSDHRPVVAKFDL